MSLEKFFVARVKRLYDFSPSVSFAMFFTVVVIVVSVIFLYYKWQFQHWSRKNFNYITPTIPFGNSENPFYPKEHDGETIKNLYNEMRKKNWKHGGVYMATTPGYLPVDLENIKNVLSKDFQYFVDREVYYNEKDDPLSAHLFAIGGSKWRRLRTKLTPTFTSGKMKAMFHILLDCESNLQRKMKIEFEKKAPVDIKEILGCFTTDIIGSCAFGLDFNTFENDNSPFRVYGKRVFNATLFEGIKLFFCFSFPNFSKILRLKIISNDVSNFFMKIVKDTVDYREKNNYVRNDFLQLLIELKNNNSENSLTIEEIAAQCFVFYLAGFETSSTTMTFALYELAKNQDIQDKARTEIENVLSQHKGQICYDSIQDMNYLNQIIDETLRKYPPLPYITRKCVKDYNTPEGDVTIHKDTVVFIPILGIHHNEEFYPNPEEFDPERFNEENKKLRPHYTHIPFGEGPRLCIGMRFGLMQTKVGLSSLLKSYKFTVNKKTKEPLQMDPYSFSLSPKGDIWLNVEKI